MTLRTLPFLASACLVHILTLIPTQAQPYRPTRTIFASSIFVENVAMHILGGQDNSNFVVSQMFSINLSTSWNTSSPDYRRLPDGYSDTQAASAILPDQRTWLVMSNMTLYSYDIPTMQWTNVSSHEDYYTTRHGMGAASDPLTGRVYIPGGDKSKMWIYEPSTDQVHLGDSQPYLQDLVNYSVAWSSALRSMVVFGGSISDNTPNNDLHAYSPVNGWSILKPSGAIPPERAAACMVPAYGGTKMVLFGGFGNPDRTGGVFGPALGDIFILDLNLMSWTRGSEAPSAEARGGHSCAVSGDYLIVWGGSFASRNDVLVYNMKTSSWTSRYVPLSTEVPTILPHVDFPMSSYGSSQDSSSKQLSGGAIAGIIVGGFAIMVALGSILFINFRRTVSQDFVPDENDTLVPTKPLDQSGQTLCASEGSRSSTMPHSTGSALATESNGPSTATPSSP